MSELMQCGVLCVMISGNHGVYTVWHSEQLILVQILPIHIGCYDDREQSHCHLQHENMTCVHSEDAGVRGSFVRDQYIVLYSYTYTSKCCIHCIL